MDVSKNTNTITFGARNVFLTKGLANCGRKVYEETVTMLPELKKVGDDTVDFFVTDSVFSRSSIKVVARDVNEELLKAEAKANPKTILGKIGKVFSNMFPLLGPKPPCGVDRLEACSFNLNTKKSNNAVKLAEDAFSILKLKRDTQSIEREIGNQYKP